MFAGLHFIVFCDERGHVAAQCLTGFRLPLPHFGMQLQRNFSAEVARFFCHSSSSDLFNGKAKIPESRQSRYWDFIRDYADEKYADSCREWCAFADQKCNEIPEMKQKNLADIFEKASLLELDFWMMAYKNEEMESCKQKSIAEMKKVPQNLHS